MPAPQGAFPVWSRVYTHPTERTFIEITEHPDAKAKAGYVWVFIAGALSGLIGTMLQFLFGLAGVQAAAQEYGTNLPSLPLAYGVSGLLWAICSMPSAGVGAVINLAVNTSLVHATAKFFGGQGTFDKLAYALGAIFAPLWLLGALTIPLNLLPYGSICTGSALSLLGLYTVYLQVTAIKAVHRCGWGEAFAAYFLPRLLLLLLCGVAFMLLWRAYGPEIRELMQLIQQLQQQRP
jgi:hypothetical protein